MFLRVGVYTVNLDHVMYIKRMSSGVYTLAFVADMGDAASEYPPSPRELVVSTEDGIAAVEAFLSGHACDAYSV